MAIWGEDKKSVQLADQIATNLSDNIAQGIKQAMEPVFTELADIVRTSMEEARKESGETALKMAESFLFALKESTSGSFENLKTEVDELTQLVKEQAEGEKQLIRNLSDSVNALREVADKQQKISEDLKMAVANSHSISVNLKEECSGTLAVVAREERVLSDEKKFFDQAMDRLGNATEQLAGTYDEVFARLDKVTESTGSYAKALESAAESLNNRFEDFNGMVTKAVDSSFEQLDKQMADIATTLSNTANDIAEAADRLPKSLNGLR